MRVVNKYFDKYRKLSAPIKASFWFMVCGVLQKGISVISTPIFTRLLSTTEYGVYSVYCSWQSILSIFVTLNLSAGVFTRGLVKNENDADGFTSAFLGLAICLTVIASIVYYIFNDFWNSIFNMNTFMISCMLITMLNNTVFGFWSTRQRVAYRYKALVCLTLFTSVLQPIISVVGIYLFPDAKVEARVFAIALIGVFTYWGLAFNQIRKNGQLFSLNYWKYALRFNIPLVPHYLSQSMLSSSDRIMIGHFCSAADAGIYSLAYSLSMLMTIINTAVTNTFSPWLYQNIRDKKYREIGSVSYFLLVVIALANLFLIAFAPEIVALFAPYEYSDAVNAIPPIAMTVFFMFMYTMFANFSFYFAKTKAIAITSFVGAVLNVLLNAIFIPIYGYMAASYTTLICYICYAIGHFVLMRQISKKYMENVEIYNLRILVLLSISFIACGFCIKFLYRYFLVRYILIVLVVLFVLFHRDRILRLLRSMNSAF